MSNLIIFTALILLIIGFVFKLIETKIIKLPTLPGDILIKKDNFVFYFPITTSLIISILISVILWLLFKK